MELPSSEVGKAEGEAVWGVKSGIRSVLDIQLDVEKTVRYQSLDFGDLQRSDWRYKSINHQYTRALKPSSSRE